MKAALNEIKKELGLRDIDDVKSLCLRLARYRKENKELLSYLLFESQDEASYVNRIKEELDEQFAALPSTNSYFVKKGLRRILRVANKQIKYSAIPNTEIEVRIHFCSNIKKHGIALTSSPVLANMYRMQLKKIDIALSKLPDDLQYDYAHDIESLQAR
jgi:hypothetical protein